MKPAAITLKMLREAAPKGWDLDETGPGNGWHMWSVSAADPARLADQESVAVFAKRRATARRAAYAALRAMKEKP